MILKNPLPILALAIAAAIAPPSGKAPSAWAGENMVEVEGPRAGQLWDGSLTPYAAPIMDEIMLGPHVQGAVRKSAQVGYSRLLTGIIGWVVCESPSTALLVMPTSGAALDFNREKLQPTIDASPLLSRRILPPSVKGQRGSSALYKAFPSGSLSLVGANSAADLRSRVMRFVFCDEVDEYPADLDGQGSPMKMIDARQTSFHALRNYRKLVGSTPTLKGESLIDEAFEDGDQRYWKMPCPHCGERIRFVFGGFADEKAGGIGLRFNRHAPFEAHYVAQCCGAVIEHWQKNAMIDAGAFEAEYPDEGRYPSWHIDAMMSKLTTWDHLAGEYADAGDDPHKLKTFTNLWLGLAYEEKHDLADWKALMLRREPYAERIIPADCLFVFMGCDVQKRGLYVEMTGWTPDRRSYTLYAEYLPAGTPTSPGDTVDPDDPCWKRLAELFETPLADSFGGKRRIDALGIDVRYNAPVVYDFVRRHHGAYALRTRDGWNVPPMAGMRVIDFDWRGKRMKRGASYWEVGSYNLKAMFHAYARREQTIDDGATTFPPGYCHFGDFLGEAYFRQMCSEYVGVDQKTKRRVWKETGEPNHWFDARIMAMALAFGSVFDIRNRSENFWRDLAAERGVPSDLISKMLVGSRAASGSKPEPSPPVAPSDPAPREDAPVVRPPAENWGFSGRWI